MKDEQQIREMIAKLDTEMTESIDGIARVQMQDISGRAYLTAHKKKLVEIASAKKAILRWVLGD